MDRSHRPISPVHWIGSSYKDYGEFPIELQEKCGYALFLAQTGQHAPSAKVLKGFGSGIVELVESFEGDAYRT